MKKLLINKKILFILLLILTFSLVEDSLSGRFFHGEMQRQIDETLKSQAAKILQGYETYDQNREILRAGIQADALELNHVHGEFLIKVMEQANRARLGGQLDKGQMERRITSIITRSEESISLKASLIWNATSRRNELSGLIKDAVQGEGKLISYLGNDSSEVLHTGALDIVIRGGTEQPWETYARAVYYQSLDLIVVFEGTSSYAEDNVARLFQRNQQNLERNIMMLGTMEDVIILQRNGYSLYSGRFGKDSTSRVTRILYNDIKDPVGLAKQISGSYGVFRTLNIPVLDQKFQERYCFIQYDNRQDQYVIVSRPTADINRREAILIVVSRLMGAVNVIVICLVAYMLISRDEAIKEEANP